MGKYSRRSWIALIFFVTQASALVIQSAQAQWNIVATNEVPPAAKYGAMQYKDGILWAGSTALVYSLDSGKTWKPTTFPGSVIYDISFANRRFGVISTQGYSFLTRDGGQTWTKIDALPISISSIICTDNEKEMYAVRWPDDKVFISNDSGNSWHTSITHPSIMTMTRASDGVLYVVSNYTNPGIVSASTDSGATWYSQPGTVGPDCWSIVADKCNPAMLYVTTENLSDNPWVSSLLVSSDRGATWTAGYSDPANVAGSVATAGSAAFAGTLTRGVLRSTDNGNTWETTGGPNGAGDNRGICMINENIAFALDHVGNIWGTFNGGGDSISIAHAGSITPASNRLFDGDTVTCDSLTRSVFLIRNGCAPPSIASVSIIGTDSASYQAGSVTYDSIPVTLHGATRGARNAQLVFTLDDGSSDTVALGGFVAPLPNLLSVSPATLFQSDTVSCNNITRSLLFHRSGCWPPSILSWSITGADSASFAASNPSYDSMLVTLHGKKNGAQHAQLILSLNDSSSDTVALAGFIDTLQSVLSVSPQALFQSDTISCDSVTSTLVFSRSGCVLPAVSAWSIVGADSANFRASNRSDDSISVTLLGRKQGEQNAKLILAIDNGSNDTVSLGGYVNISPQALSVSTADVTTTILGGTVAVPITINGLLHSEDIELVMQYDGSLDYLGSFSPSGAKLDVSGEQSAGRSELRIAGAAPGAIAGYATFNVFNDSNTTAHVSFSGLRVLTAASPCEYSAPTDTAKSTITAPSGCGAQTLSRLVHLGAMPKLTVQPNPTAEDVTISSSADLGEVTIILYDMLGSERSRWEENIERNTPVPLLLPGADGVYTIVVNSAAGMYHLRVIRQH